MTEDIASCLAGDRKAERRLYDQHLRGVYLTVLRYVGSVELAEELTGDTFIKIFKNLSSYQELEGGSLKAWMQKIAVNTALNELRKKQLLILPEEEIVDLAEPNMPDSKLAYDDILKLITQLPIGYRTSTYML